MVVSEGEGEGGVFAERMGVDFGKTEDVVRKVGEEVLFGESDTSLVEQKARCRRRWSGVFSDRKWASLVREKKMS